MPGHAQRRVAVPDLTWDWQDRAACRDTPTEVFYGCDAEPAVARAVRETEALAICARCPVVAECLLHALALQETYGIWGGMTEHDRAMLRRSGARDSAA